ncbi:MAG: GspE/PulE family protein [Myxococcota bacterium]
MRRKLRIGELLVENGLLTAEQLTKALQAQKKRGRRLGQILVDLGYVEEAQLLDFLARQLDIPFVDLSTRDLAPTTVHRLPEQHARRFNAIVLGGKGKDLEVGLADPTDLLALDELSRILKCSIQPALVREADLIEAIERFYRRTDEISNLAMQLDEELGGEQQIDLADLEAEERGSEAPVAKLLKSVFEEAVQVSASDIHIEPDENVLRIRQRVDGVLREQVMKETRIASALVLRIKLMSSLDISEKRLPQDGRFNIKVSQKTIDVRVPTLPVQHGEAVVMPLLDQAAGTESLDQLGLPETMLVRLRGLIHRPYGLILVTGPTGSGKTTTLYAALRELNEPGKKIITVEDPVEYRLERINQVQVNSKVNLTFARVLRASLRQDPDIIMIGEMRDQETVETGLRAAMTGHLVLSTLHTNDAISTPLRLIDMGAEGYLAASALRAVIAQRLVRKICRNCCEPYEPDGRERAWLSGLEEGAGDEGGFFHGSGCGKCNQTGYRGRLGVYELLEIDETIGAALRDGQQSAYERAARAKPEFRPLALAALDYARDRVTTLQEVFRLAEEVEDTPEAEKAPTGVASDGEAAALGEDEEVLGARTEAYLGE